MGRQTGTVRIQGKVGNLTFAKTSNGDEVRLNTSLNGKKMRKGKRFKRTRENWAEFGNAGKASKLIRRAFALMTNGITDRLSYSRMVTAALKTVKSDPTSARGERQFQLGDMDYLLNYQFNDRQPLTETYKSEYLINIDRAAGTVDIDIPALIPEIAVGFLDGASHFKLGAAVAEIDWVNNTYVYDGASTSEIEYGAQTEAAQTLNLTVPAGSAQTLVIIFGVWYYQLVNGVYYILEDGTRNALGIIAIDNP